MKARPLMLPVVASIGTPRYGQAPARPAPTVTAVDYSRAEQLLPWNTSRMTFGDEVAPQFFQELDD
jgi:hypothetical protein